MSIGIVGKKLGMTRVFTEEGDSAPVTVIEVEPNRITQIKAKETEGYNALQITTGNRRASRVTRPMAGHFAKAKTEAGRLVREFRLEDDAEIEYELGAKLDIDMFEVGQKVDVIGLSRGFGFQGGIKRHNFRGQDNSHGNSVSHRAPGSIGQCQTPGRVFKGKKMAGHMGAERVTIQNLQVVQVDAEKGLLLIKGAVPGSKGGDVIVQPAVKAKNQE